MHRSLRYFLFLQISESLFLCQIHYCIWFNVQFDVVFLNVKPHVIGQRIRALRSFRTALDLHQKIVKDRWGPGTAPRFDTEGQGLFSSMLQASLYFASVWFIKSMCDLSWRIISYRVVLSGNKCIRGHWRFIRIWQILVMKQRRCFLRWWWRFFFRFRANSSICCNFYV